MSWLPKKTVVVPIDFSTHSVKAAETACTMVDDGSSLHLVHVLAPPVVGTVPANVDEAGRREHEQKLFAKTFSSPAYQGASFIVLEGDPGSEIAAYAERVSAELIVLPSHGYTGLKHLMIGSVAERVVRLAHCPVLVLRH